MKTLAIIFFVSFVSFTMGQEVTNYDLNLNIDVKSKSVRIEGMIDFDFKDNDSAKLVLWKDTFIKEISVSNVPVKYFFDVSSHSPIMYIPNGRNLTVYKPSTGNNTYSMKFVYNCNMTELNGWARSFTEDWIELNFYCAWFPVCTSSGNFTSQINISIDSDYIVSGSGNVHRKNESWEMIQPWSSFDIVIVASKNLKSKILNEDDVFIQTDYSEFTPLEADSMIAEWRYILDLYENYFGKKDSSYLKFVIAPFEKGGGYSRKHFVRLGTKEFGYYARTGIAHEAAHFWWTGANTSTWEDWLNEAFAEYSMMLYVRNRLGENEFNNKIDEYKGRTKNLPPVWGIDRNSPEAYSVLYEKGALILFEFENKVGKQKFIHLLRKVADNRITTTEKLLELIEKEFSNETRQWMETQLKTA